MKEPRAGHPLSDFFDLEKAMAAFNARAGSAEAFRVALIYERRGDLRNAVSYFDKATEYSTPRERETGSPGARAGRLRLALAGAAACQSTVLWVLHGDASRTAARVMDSLPPPDGVTVSDLERNFHVPPYSLDWLGLHLLADWHQAMAIAIRPSMIADDERRHRMYVFAEEVRASLAGLTWDPMAVSLSGGGALHVPEVVGGTQIHDGDHEEWLREWPDGDSESETCARLGIASYQMGRDEDAVRYFREAVQLNPTYELVRRWLKKLQSK